MARANPGKLSTTSYAVLGLVAQFGEATPHQVIEYGRHSVANFWDFARSQVYDEVDRLVARGFLAEQREPAGRRRRTLTLTRAGRAALLDWVTTPTEAPLQVRHEGLLKVFFAGLADADAVTSHIEQQLRATQERHDLLAALAEQFDRDHPDLEPSHPDYTIRVVLEAGVRIDSTMLQFWRELHDRGATSPNRTTRRRTKRSD